jgi:hypothetical protein
MGDINPPDMRELNMAIYRQLSREAAAKGELSALGSSLQLRSFLTPPPIRLFTSYRPAMSREQASVPQMRRRRGAHSAPHRVKDASVSLQEASMGTERARVDTPEVQVPSVVTQGSKFRHPGSPGGACHKNWGPGGTGRKR